MSITRNNYLKRAGLMLIAAIVYGAVFLLLLYNIVMAVIDIVAYAALVLYCFVLCKTKQDRIYYYICFGVFALKSIYWCISIPTVLNLICHVTLFILAIGFIAIKAKPHKSVSIAVAIAMLIYAAVGICNAIMLDRIVVFTIAYYPLNLVAFAYIWLGEGGISVLKSKSNTDMLIALKQLYESKEITEKEYSEKKAEILEKL